MADGAYERRQGREAEIKRFARIIAEVKKSNSEETRSAGGRFAEDPNAPKLRV